MIHCEATIFGNITIFLLSSITITQITFYVPGTPPTSLQKFILIELQSQKSFFVVYHPKYSKKWTNNDEMETSCYKN